MSSDWEPDWHVPQNVMRAATLLGISNNLEVQFGLGATTAHDLLRATRNVVAHSLPNTWLKFKAYQRGKPVFTPPAEFTIQIEPTSGKRLFDSWAEELEGAIKLASE